MVRLENITAGSCIAGIEGVDAGAVTILSVRWLGTAAVEADFRNSAGRRESRLLMRQDEAQLSLVREALPWSFDADGEQFRLISEARRIQDASLFDPYLAIHTSSVEPLPHQITAVYGELLTRIPLRYVLADDPGAGKTIMAGLFIRELIARGDLKRCLIVCPGGLAEQWQDELLRKFHLNFDLLGNERLASAAGGNAFADVGLGIARLDKLARSDELQAQLKECQWDLVIFDEAHKLSATVWGGKIHTTRRFALGRLLAGRTRHLLLLTATPHNGREEDFQLFLSLLDPDRFGGVARAGAQAVSVSDVMRRMVKEELVRFDGSPLFPERHAMTVSYSLSPQETALYEAVTTYVQTEFNRADTLAGGRRTTVGFALTVLQRRLASSPEAICQSLHRRRERLEDRLAWERLGAPGSPDGQLSQADYEDDEELSADERERVEDLLADRATASSTIQELEAEIATLRSLEHMAEEVRSSGTDRKWEELSALLQDEACMFTPDGQREKIIIFTEHRDTLTSLVSRTGSLLGNADAVVRIDGSLSRAERRRVEERFCQDRQVVVLVATDAAGEGLNLQRAHLMVNYDLPWNPNRIEQRFGRIHRIGQEKACWLWNLVAAQTREGQVFRRLFEKLEQERAALGGKVFDVLGKVTFDNRPLRDLLIEAVRRGNEAPVRQKLAETIDRAFRTDELIRLIQEHALTNDILDAKTLARVREDMEKAEARRLQPYFVEAFFREAFRSLGGTMEAREPGRFEITHVPACVRSRDLQICGGEPVLERYERVCFDKRCRTVPGGVQAAQICPGHPLLEAVLAVLLERSADVLRRGAVLVDTSDPGDRARLLFSIQHAIQDGVRQPDGKLRIISRRLHFVELDEAGGARSGGYAPYLDYRPATDEERQAVLTHMAGQTWPGSDVEQYAVSYAAAHLVPEHLDQVRSRREALIEKTARAVRQRLTAEIQYWDYRAGELKTEEDAGKRTTGISSGQARRRADELAERLETRLAELEIEKHITACAPVVLSGALIIPAGLLTRLTGGTPEADEPAATQADPAARKAVERAAMQAVMAAERAQGYIPRDVSAEKCGCDIESRVPDAACRGQPGLRLIEVKGRTTGAGTITVTRNEILTALNKPEHFFLAVVEVTFKGSQSRTPLVVYIKKPFVSTPDFAAESTTFNLKALMQSSEVYEMRGTDEPVQEETH